MTRPPPQLFVLFGASGDLARRKLFPSLFELFLRGMLPEKFAVLGVGRTKISADEFRATRAAAIGQSENVRGASRKMLDEFFSLVEYVDFDTDSPDAYGTLVDAVRRVRERRGIGGNALFYLAIPPSRYGTVVENIGHCGLARSRTGWRRIVVEKPFGSDLKTARSLGAKLRSVFGAQNVYRIDHYLGKETVQNILALRFSNGIFEPLWNRNYIDSVEISATETAGVGMRGAYYDNAGALRDMVQNHLFALMSFAAMECPASFDSPSIRDEISKVMRAVRPLSDADILKNVVRGQYVGGRIGGIEIPSYRDENGVPKYSQTETYVALKLFIDNWRWGGVPFYFYTGKRLSVKRSEIVVNFKSAPIPMFAGQCGGTSCNKLAMRIQPDESVSLMFGLKVPGEGFQVRRVAMNFEYSSLANTALPDAYSRLLSDAMCGDSTLFARDDAIESGWKIVDVIEDFWRRQGAAGLEYYAAGSRGTAGGEAMSLEHLGAACQLPPSSALSKPLDDLHRL